MSASKSTFQIEIEQTAGLCPAGERYALQHLHERHIPVLSCEGPCIRGEIARQAAHRVASQRPYARACQGEAVAVPGSAMARWVRESDKVVVLDGCFLRCQARMMRRLLRPDQLVEIDAMAIYKRYGDLYEIDSVPEIERNAAADDVAKRVLIELATLDNSTDPEKGSCDDCRKASKPASCGEKSTRVRAAQKATG
jgi:uncharacterized metal-binding protein